MNPVFICKIANRTAAGRPLARYRCPCGKTFERAISVVNTKLNEGSPVYCGRLCPLRPAKTEASYDNPFGQKPPPYLQDTPEVNDLNNPFINYLQNGGEDKHPFDVEEEEDDDEHPGWVASIRDVEDF